MNTETKMKILKRLDPSEIYDGKVAASSQNEDHIYELHMGGLSYRVIARIENGKAVKIPDGARFRRLLAVRQSPSGVIWVETEESRKLDPMARREDALKELGI
jgi:hypothetical protein